MNSFQWCFPWSWLRCVSISKKNNGFFFILKMRTNICYIGKTKGCKYSSLKVCFFQRKSCFNAFNNIRGTLTFLYFNGWAFNNPLWTFFYFYICFIARYWIKVCYLRGTDLTMSITRKSNKCRIECVRIWIIVSLFLLSNRLLIVILHKHMPLIATHFMSLKKDISLQKIYYDY